MRLILAWTKVRGSDATTSCTRLVTFDLSAAESSMAGQQYFLKTNIPARSISAVDLRGLRWLEARSEREVVRQVRIAIFSRFELSLKEN